MKRVKTLILLFITWTLIGAVSKIAFMAVYHELLSGVSLCDLCMVIWSGVQLDMSIAVYMSIVPLLLLLSDIVIKVMGRQCDKVIRFVWLGYFAFAAFVTSLAYVANIGLYGYWNFPLDSTPLLYLRTSPADAMASLTTWQLTGAVVVVLVVAVGIFLLFRWVLYATKVPSFSPKGEGTKTDVAQQTGKKAFGEAVAVLVVGGLLFIPLRGGTGTGTIHVGSVYFSDNMRLNHAAVNPVFCFIESVTHQKNDDARYHFMDDAKADRIFKEMMAANSEQFSPKGKATGTVATVNNGKAPVLTVKKPDILIICLESFSREVMKAKDEHGNDVTPCINALTKEGIYFTNFYANSFRTDRAMVSILSALPAQPTASIMDDPHKSNCLPSLARTLGRAGYVSSFYYGGDTNFSNMRSYYVGTGFKNIIAEESFPASKRVCKWGVPDADVFARVLNDASKKSATPMLRFFMTESSHEPYDVPHYNKVKSSKELNAFAYADSCLGRFIADFRKTAQWKNTLVLILPDHLGVYPLQIDNYKLWRYQLPLIMTGGAISEKRTVDTFCCQTDIAATLLAMMGMRHDEFVFSHDIFSDTPNYGFFTFPDGMGLVDAHGHVIYDNVSQQVASQQGNAGVYITRAKAFLQTLYKYIGNLPQPLQRRGE